MDLILSKIIKQNKAWVKITGQFDQHSITSLNQIPSSVHIKDQNEFHFLYNKENYQQFLHLNIPFSIKKTFGTTVAKATKGDHTDISSTNEEHTVLPKPKVVKVADKSRKRAQTTITWNDSNFYVSLPYDEEDVSYLRKLKGSWWQAKQKLWVVRSTLYNLSKLQSHFGYWNSDNYAKIIDLVSATNDPLIIELYVTPEHQNSFSIQLKGFRADYTFLKNLSHRNYDKRYKRWVIPYHEATIARIIDHYTTEGAKIINRIPEKGMTYKSKESSFKEKQDHLLSKFDIKYFKILRKYTDTLISQRYSWKTVTSYTGGFIKFLQFLSIPITETNALDVNRYLAELAGSKLSDATINKAINAIKFYYQKVEFLPNFQIEKVKRPRNGRKLPTILSKNEVDRILRASSNLKHITILYTLYGSGLRLNEILSIKISDIYWDRNQIFIRGGKGKKDRVVMLSQSIKPLLEKYFNFYKPIYWLFEGQDKESQYSTRSVQNIVKAAAKKAGISRNVTPHTLRHCFATHLMDGGVQIQYIQELLGHKDIKTTLIYTHVTIKNATAIQSPLDNLYLGKSYDQ